MIKQNNLKQQVKGFIPLEDGEQVLAQEVRGFVPLPEDESVAPPPIQEEKTYGQRIAQFGKGMVGDLGDMADVATSIATLPKYLPNTPAPVSDYDYVSYYQNNEMPTAEAVEQSVKAWMENGNFKLGKKIRDKVDDLTGGYTKTEEGDTVGKAMDFMGAMFNPTTSLVKLTKALGYIPKGAEAVKTALTGVGKTLKTELGLGSLAAAGGATVLTHGTDKIFNENQILGMAEDSIKTMIGSRYGAKLSRFNTVFKKPVNDILYSSNADKELIAYSKELGIELPMHKKFNYPMMEFLGENVFKGWFASKAWKSAKENLGESSRQVLKDNLDWGLPKENIHSVLDEIELMYSAKVEKTKKVYGDFKDNLKTQVLPSHLIEGEDILDEAYKFYSVKKNSAVGDVSGEIADFTEQMLEKNFYIGGKKINILDAANTYQTLNLPEKDFTKWVKTAFGGKVKVNTHAIIDLPEEFNNVAGGNKQIQAKGESLKNTIDRTIFNCEELSGFKDMKEMRAIYHSNVFKDIKEDLTSALTDSKFPAIAYRFTKDEAGLNALEKILSDDAYSKSLFDKMRRAKIEEEITSRVFPRLDDGTAFSKDIDATSLKNIFLDETKKTYYQKLLGNEQYNKLQKLAYITDKTDTKGVLNDIFANLKNYKSISALTAFGTLGYFCGWKGVLVTVPLAKFTGYVLSKPKVMGCIEKIIQDKKNRKMHFDELTDWVDKFDARYGERALGFMAKGVGREFLDQQRAEQQGEYALQMPFEEESVKEIENYTPPVEAQDPNIDMQNEQMQTPQGYGINNDYNIQPTSYNPNSPQEEQFNPQLEQFRQFEQEDAYNRYQNGIDDHEQGPPAPMTDEEYIEQNRRPPQNPAEAGWGDTQVANDLTYNPFNTPQAKKKKTVKYERQNPSRAKNLLELDI